MASTPFCGSAFMIDIGMIPKAAGVRLTPEDRAALEARLRAPRTEQRDAFRAPIVLMAGEGHSTRSIARTLKNMPQTVSTRRGRFAREGLAGLADKPRSGPKPKYGPRWNGLLRQDLRVGPGRFWRAKAGSE
jgi:Winged helix-turn helix